MVEPVEVDEANHAGKISTPVLSSRSGCQQRGETKNTLPSRAAGWLSTALNVWWISQGESERSERSQIEDVTNYSSNVAQGSQAIDRPKPYTQPRQRSSYGHYSATQDQFGDHTEYRRQAYEPYNVHMPAKVHTAGSVGNQPSGTCRSWALTIYPEPTKDEAVLSACR